MSYVGVIWCLFSAFRFSLAAIFISGGSTVRVCSTSNPLEAYVLPGDHLWLIPGVHQVVAPPSASSRGSIILII